MCWGVVPFSLLWSWSGRDKTWVSGRDFTVVCTSFWSTMASALISVRRLPWSSLFWVPTWPWIHAMPSILRTFWRPIWAWSLMVPSWRRSVHILFLAISLCFPVCASVVSLDMRAARSFSFLWRTLLLCLMVPKPLRISALPLFRVCIPRIVSAWSLANLDFSQLNRIVIAHFLRSRALMRLPLPSIMRARSLSWAAFVSRPSSPSCRPRSCLLVYLLPTKNKLGVFNGLNGFFVVNSIVDDHSRNVLPHILHKSKPLKNRNVVQQLLVFPVVIPVQNWHTVFRLEGIWNWWIVKNNSVLKPSSKPLHILYKYPIVESAVFSKKQVGAKALRVEVLHEGFGVLWERSRENDQFEEKAHPLEKLVCSRPN